MTDPQAVKDPPRPSPTCALADPRGPGSAAPGSCQPDRPSDDDERAPIARDGGIIEPFRSRARTGRRRLDSAPRSSSSAPNALRSGLDRRSERVVSELALPLAVLVAFGREDLVLLPSARPAGARRRGFALLLRRTPTRQIPMAAAHSAGARATSSGPANAKRMPAPGGDAGVGRTEGERWLAETSDAHER